MNDIIPFSFDEQAIRVLVIHDEPWFVANDLCAVLAIVNPRHAVARLDDDEKAVASSDTLGGNQSLNIVSESGMYSLVLGSRKPEARRFKKWVTSELLPTLRRTGRYIMPSAAQPLVSPDIDPPRIMAAVTLANAARKLFGLATARRVWVQCGLPVALAESVAEREDDPMAPPVRAWIAGRSGFTSRECAAGIGIADPDQSVLNRIANLLRGCGYSWRKARRPEGVIRVYFSPADTMALGEEEA